MFDKLKQKVLKKGAQPLHYDLPPPGESTEKRFIYQNRYNYGANFGSMFVLEKYIFDSLFNHGGENEFDAISAHIKATSASQTSLKLAKHYSDYLNRVNWGWLNDVGCTAIRLPIGYWHVKNGELMNSGQKFYQIKDVYINAKPWEEVKRLIYLANQNRIGVLIDLHALPGGANGDSHSGEKNGGDGKFFSNERSVKFMADVVLPYLIQDLSNFDNIIGLQIVNECQFNSVGKMEKKYYERAIKAIRQFDPYMPIIISDGWWPEQWVEWIHKEKYFADVVIDSHVYRCFSDSDKEKSPDEIINDLEKSIQFDQSRADFVVGEFSCVLDGSSWGRGNYNREEVVRRYGQAQTSLFRKKASWGWFFWTFQFEHGDGGEWGYKPMIERNCIPKRPKTWKKPDDKAIKNIISQHVSYWSDKGGEKMQHWRFEDALRNTIKDIQTFTEFDNSLLGRTYAWKCIRREQYIREKGEGEYMWEWDQGFEQAISNFNHY